MLVKYFQENSVSLPIFDTDAGIIIPIAGVAHDDTERESGHKTLACLCNQFYQPIQLY